MIALLACLLTLCSDDMLGRLGNERLCWDASQGATYYQVGVWSQGVVAICGATNGTCFDLPPTACYGDALVVRACDAADVCSEWSYDRPVQVWPFGCLRSTGCTYSDDGDTRNDRCSVCEERCFDGAPLRMPNVPECS